MAEVASILKHELGMEGFTITPTELSLTSLLEYEFVTLAIKFCQQMESDIKAKKISRRITINEYMAKHASKVIGGRRDRVETKISKFVNCMDFRGRSKEIKLYTWLCEINANIKLVSIHNLIIKKFQGIDREFMDSPKRSLKNFSHPLKDVIDLVGKHISQKSLRIFIEMVEGNPRTSSGGIRDKKIPVVVVIRSAMQAVHETQTVKTNKKKQKQGEIFEYDEPTQGYHVRGRAESEDEEDDYDYEEDDQDYEQDYDEEVDPEKKEKMKDDLQELTKIAHRYVFGNKGGIEALKKRVEQELEEEDLTEEELLEKKLKELEQKKEEAERRNEQYEKLYEIVLDLFNKAKYNYTQFGKEIRYIDNLCTFFETIYDGDKTILKEVRQIKREEVPDMKKLKLVIGKCLERASGEIYNNDEPVFKFAIDREDYENDIDQKKKETEIFELLNRSPPVPDQKGLKNARTRLREFQKVDHSSPIKDRNSQQLTHDGDEFRDMMLMLRSEYYKDFQEKNATMDLKDDEGEEEEIVDELDQATLPKNIFTGIAKLFLKLHKSKKKKKSKKKRRKGRSRSRSTSRSRKGKRSRSNSRKPKKSKPEPVSEEEYRLEEEPKEVVPPIPVPPPKIKKESPQKTSSRRKNWKNSEPIFKSPGSMKYEPLPPPRKTPDPKKFEQIEVSPPKESMINIQDQSEEEGPTLEDTYNIPKKRRKVKRRVPKKTNAFGSSKKKSKSRSKSKRRRKKKTVVKKKPTTRTTNKLMGTQPGFSAIVKTKSKSPAPVKKRRVGKFKTKAKY